MPKAIDISPSTPVSSASHHSDTHELVSVALFSGAGLLVSLVVVLMSMQNFWA
jgi:hypothetical protein